MPEGLTWAALTQITRTALHSGGCRGWSVGVYNPDLDPDGRDARQVVAYLDEVTKRAGAGGAT
jgi:arginase